MYKHSLLLHSVYNFERPTLEWVKLNFNQYFKQREKNLKAHNISNYKVGKTNSLANRFICLNTLIPLDWLNLKKNKYKLLGKRTFFRFRDTTYTPGSLLSIYNTIHQFMFCDVFFHKSVYITCLK